MADPLLDPKRKLPHIYDADYQQVVQSARQLICTGRDIEKKQREISNNYYYYTLLCYLLFQFKLLLLRTYYYYLFFNFKLKCRQCFFIVL